MTEAGTTAKVRPMTHADIPVVESLQRICFPPPFPVEELWTADDLEDHLARFPEGQFVAILDEEVIGSASNVIVSEKDWLARRSWAEMAGTTKLLNHQPSGTTLFGLDISVSPVARGRGVARSLYRARLELVRALGLARYGTACRLPGLQRYPELSPEAFVAEVRSGRLTDSPLTPFLKIGMRFVEVVHGFLDDPESRNCSAFLEWTP